MISPSKIRSLKVFEEEYEKTEVAISQLQYLLESGQVVREAVSDITKGITSWSGRRERLAQALLNGTIISTDEIPQVLRSDAISSSLMSTSQTLQTEIRNLGKESVILADLEVDGAPVSLASWRRFNAANIANLDLRRHAFDGIIELAYEHLRKPVQALFEAGRTAYSQYGTDPVSVFAQDAGISVERLKAIIHKSGTVARDPFLDLASRVWPEVLGHPINPVDDLYVWRPVVFTEFDEAYANQEPMTNFAQIMRQLGMNGFAKYVEIDDVPRPDKTPSPSDHPIKIPNRNIIVFKKGRPFENATSGYHEGGHACHLTEIDPNLPTSQRVLFPLSDIEIPSTIFETIATDPVYLRELGMDEETIGRVSERERFNELLYLQFYAALSLTKIAIYEEGLEIDQACERFEQLTEQYGIKLPGQYILTHHIIPRYMAVYSPAYLLAKIRAEDIVAGMKEEYGEDWWNNPEAGGFLRESLFRPGNNVDLNEFSSLDSNSYFDRVVGNSI